MTKRITKIDNNTLTSRSVKVAAYCRVSTDMSDQLESLDAQKQHYENLISSKQSWVSAGVYYDEGISGTRKDKRPALNTLIRDCEDGKIDLVITKSVSRFARNTTDCLELVRKLSSHGINIIFEQENINTGDMEGELILTILSSLAEQESVSISQNCKWSVKKRFESGTFVIASPPYGYRNVDGEMVVVAEEAVVVRRIFSDFLSGVSARHIAMNLESEGIPTLRGGKWQASTITAILKNEKYTGDVIYQKTWTDNRFRRHVNTGDYDSYLIRDHHEAIITRDEYDAAQELMLKHFEDKGGERDTDKYLVRYPLTGKLICSECGKPLRRKIYKRDEGKHIVWACGTHIDDKDACPMKAIQQEVIEAAFTTMMNKLIFSVDIVIKPFIRDLSSIEKSDVMAEINDIQEKIEDNNTKRDRLVDFLRKGLLDPEIVNQENNHLLEESRVLQDRADSLRDCIKAESEYIRAGEELLRHLHKSEMKTEFDVSDFIRFVDHVTVHSQHEVSFKLYCGLTFREVM